MESAASSIRPAGWILPVPALEAGKRQCRGPWFFANKNPHCFLRGVGGISDGGGEGRERKHLENNWAKS